MKKRILTGITTTGIPHLGNYVGAIKPAIELSQHNNHDSFLFLANYHALIKCHDPSIIFSSTLNVAATWLACGLDHNNVTFYRQSDIPELTELSWILTCNCAKGLMNRAHAYKAAVQENEKNNIHDEDHAIEMGLYSYPILMAADILMFNADLVPVGKDQLQHLEMTRDIASRFNSRFKNLFNLPQAVINENIPILAGLDGRKMSKSYGNTIPLFEDEKKLRKSIMKIVTNSLEPGEPKDFNDSVLFDIYFAFASPQQIEEMKNKYKNGISWGEVKQELFELINIELSPMRENFQALIQKPAIIEEILHEGANKARIKSKMLLEEIKESIGIKKLT